MPARLAARAPWSPWALLLITLLAGGVRCAKSQCEINSDCGRMRYCDESQLCRQDCAEDRDCTGGYCDINGRCTAGARPDAGPADGATDADTAEVSADVPLDAPLDAPPDTALPDVPGDVPDDASPPDMDVPVPPMDVPPPVDIPPPPVDIPPPPVDIPPPPPDVPVTGHAVYLDPCSLDSDCASSMCAPGAGGSRFCSRHCTVQPDCGLGYECAAGRCLPDDTGTPCTTAASRCHVYCFGTAMNSQCTHDCSGAADCPAGYACSGTSTGGGPPNVCVQIEIPQAMGCPSTLYNTTTGCTARCHTALDCPRMWPDFPSGYTCQPSGAFMVCVPPAGLVIGSDPMGSTCPMTGPVYCRSGACDTTSTPPVCIEVCTVTGGCPVGWGCKPEPGDPATRLDLVCRPAGTFALGATCTRGGQCATALCQASGSGTTGYCTRMCNDGYCPTGMTCTPTGGAAPDGTPISLCVR